MKNFAMAGWLLAACFLLELRPVLAQRLVVQTAELRAGQGVFLDVKYAHTVQVRPGPGLRVEARVRINGDTGNDLYHLEVVTTDGEVQVLEKLDEARLRETTYAGDCDGGSRTNATGGVHGGYTRSPVTGGLRPTLSYHQGRYSYCVQVDYTVTLPAGTALRLNTLSGDLDLSGLSGPVTAKTVSGDVLLADLRGPVVAKSVSGDLKLRNLGTQPVEASSISGDVDLTWPAAQSAELNLQTISGEVYADEAVTFSNLRAHSPVGYELHGNLGSGGPLLTLHSISGDVFVRRPK